MVARIVFLIFAMLLRLAAGAGLSENMIERQQAVSCAHEWMEAWNSHDLRAGVRSITICYRTVRASGDDQVRKPRNRPVANQCGVRQLMSVLSGGRRTQ